MIKVHSQVTHPAVHSGVLCNTLLFGSLYSLFIKKVDEFYILVIQDMGFTVVIRGMGAYADFNSIPPITDEWRAHNAGTW